MQHFGRPASMRQAPASHAHGIAVLKVPARPFIAPVFDKYASDAEQVSRRFLNAWPPISAATSVTRDPGV
jgi:hypothetical protein